MRATSYVTKAGRIECKDELEAYIKEHGKPVDDGIDPNDRTTWVCRKDGKWLSEHPESVGFNFSRSLNPSR